MRKNNPIHLLSLTVNLPIREYYTSNYQHNEANIQRKIDNLLWSVTLYKRETFIIAHVDIMPESLPAVIS
ncbi:plasmid segregation protein ParM domain-containing protein [Rahnella aceris]|uniref:plasmid segregation protein ParM domain-containing protein n=1 Tax=Rahnella sp. (strain Y9602) TaxID=2703885 RepID=UPI00187D5FF8